MDSLLDATPVERTSAYRRASRTTRFQVLLLGLISFSVPGMFNAITSMAGGVDSPAVASQAAAALYVTFAAASLLAPVPTNVCGARLTMGVGSLGYAVYAGSLLLFRQRLAGAAWVVGAAVVNGVGAALFFTAGGTLLLALPSAETRGHYLALYQVHHLSP